MKTTIPIPAIRRYPGYYYAAVRALNIGQEYISTSELAEGHNVTSIQIRKDLEHSGVKGKPRLGYLCQDIKERIGEIIGLNVRNRAILVGAGTLGSALLSHNGFKRYGIEISAAFDISQPIQAIGEIPVFPMEQMADFVEKNRITLAVLTVPASAASDAAEHCSKSGIQAVWNFTTEKIDPELRMFVSNIDLGMILASVFAEFKRS